MKITDIPKREMTKDEWLAVVLAGLPGAKEADHGMRAAFLVRIEWRGKWIEDNWNSVDPHEFVREATAKIAGDQSPSYQPGQ